MIYYRHRVRNNSGIVGIRLIECENQNSIAYMCNIEIDPETPWLGVSIKSMLKLYRLHGIERNLINELPIRQDG